MVFGLFPFTGFYLSASIFYFIMQHSTGYRLPNNGPAPVHVIFLLVAGTQVSPGMDTS